MIFFFQEPALSELSETRPRDFVQKKVLENGLTVIIKEERAHPLVTIIATIDAGLSSEGDYIGSGISHFIEHMIFKGDPKRKAGDVEEEIKSYGGAMNASTGLDSTNVYITVPKEYAKNALSLMSDIVFNPALDPKELEKEKEVILKEIRLNRDDPTRRIMRDLWRTAYLEHPYKMPVIGFEDLFMALKREDLIKYHSLRYSPENVILAVVGDVDADEMLTAIKSAFGKYQRKGGPLIAVPEEPKQNSPREITDFAEINLGYLTMGYHTVELSSDDLYALDVLGIILGDWDGSRLNKELVKERELLYAVSASNYTPRYPGLFIIYGIGDYKNLEEAEKEILAEINKIVESGVEPAELEAAKNMVIASYINSFETTHGLAQVISQSQFLAGDANFYKNYVKRVKGLDVRVVREAARKYLNENNITVSRLYPKKFRDEVAEGAYHSSAETTGKNQVPRKIVLSNGIRLVLLEDARIPKISIVCVFPGGVLAETKENNGISNLASAMLLKGTKKRKESEIKSALESLGGGISHFSGNNSFGVSIETLSENWGVALDILEDVIKNPSFPDEELKKEKEKIYAAIKREDDDIYDTGFLRLKKALFGGYPYGLRAIGEVASVENLKRGDLEEFYKRFSSSGGMIISAVGAFPADKIKEDFEKRFSQLKDTSSGFKAPEAPPFDGIKKINFDMPKEQSLIIAGFRGPAIASEDKYRISILSSILSGQNGRLFEAIRNKLGLSYALGIFQTPGINTGYIASYVATDKQKLDKAKEALLRELEAVRRGDISEKELELAKSALIGSHKMSLEVYQSLAYQMALDELYGLGYAHYKDYPAIIEKITLRDVKEAARKYIDLGNYVVLAISGERD